MLYRTTVYLFGFVLAVSGGINLVAYMNLLALGYGYTDYFIYIVERPECYLLIVGIAIIWYAIYGIRSSDG